MVKRKAALAFADTSSRGDEDFKTTRRSRRIGNVNPQRAEASSAEDSDTDDDFVTLLPSTGAAMTSSSSSPTQRGERHQQRTGTKNHHQRRAVQRDIETLRQQEEEDILRAIELSRLDMEAERKLSPSQDERSYKFPLEPQEQDSDSQPSPPASRKSVSSRANEGVDTSFQKQFANTIKSESAQLSSSSSSTTDESEKAPSPEMAQATNFTEWQDYEASTDWEDPSLSVGVAGSERGTANFTKTDGRFVIEGNKGESDHSGNSQHPNSADTFTSSQTLPDSRRGRLRLRKRHVEEVDPPQPKQPARVQRIPDPSDPALAEELDETEGEEEEEEEVDVGTNEREMAGQDGLDEDEDSCQTAPHLEVFQLVDTRKPFHPKQPLYAPRNVSKDAYTKVIYQLIQAYCHRLRRAQVRVWTRVSWGKPVVTGNCYSDTLVHRKRGSRACMFYALSDSEDEQGTSGGNQGKSSVLEQDKSPLTGSLQKCKNKEVIDDDDSDFEDFIPADLHKASVQDRRKLVAQDVVEMLKQDGRCFQEERADGTLSQTLVQDQMDTQDFCGFPTDATKISELESDLSQPVLKDTSSHRVHNSDNSKTPPRERRDSQSSLTDIFRASSSNKTDSGLETGTSNLQQAPGTFIKNPGEDSSVGQKKTVGKDGENGSEVDSFDEEIPSLNIPRTASQCAENVKASPKKNDLQTKSVDYSQDSPSLSCPRFRNTTGTAGSEKELLGNSSQLEEDSIREKRRPCSISADSSRNKFMSQKSVRTGSLSYEEDRFQFYQKLPVSLRHQFFGEPEGRRRSLDLEDSAEEDDDQQSVEQQRTDQVEQQSLHNKHNSSHSRRGAEKQQGNKKANGFHDNRCERRPSPSKSMQSLLINSRGTSKQQELLTSSTVCKNQEEDVVHCKDFGEAGNPKQRGVEWDDLGDEQTEDDDRDDLYNNEGGHQDEEETDGKQEEEEDYLSEDEEDARKEEKLDSVPVTEVGGHQDDAEDDVLSDPFQTDGQDDAEDDVSSESLLAERQEEAEFGEEEDTTTVEDGNVEDTHQPSMIGVECPLCGVKYHIDQIEAHASECNGLTSPKREEEERLDAIQPADEADFGKGQLWTDQRSVGDSVTSTAPNHSESLAGPSTVGHHNQREEATRDQQKSRPLRGVAVRILREDISKRKSHSAVESVLGKRSATGLGPDEESSESFSESADQLDATLLQLVEDNNIQLRERKRTRAPDRPAKRQKLSNADKRNGANSSVEATELCFICNQQIPKSTYAEHVQKEVDRVEAEKHLQDTPVVPRRGLRHKTTASRAAGGEASMDADHDTEQSATTSSISHTAEDCTSWEGEPDKDSESDDDVSPCAPADALFDPRVSESPIKSFRPISKQPMNLIDFKNQFNSNGSTKWTCTSSGASSLRKGRRGPGSRAGRGRKKKKGKKRGKCSYKN